MAQPRERQHQERLDPTHWSKNLIKKQWDLLGLCLREFGQLAPTSVRRSVELTRHGKLPTPLDWVDYAVDAGQRWLITLDTLRQRGNQYFEHEAAGLPPVLNFEYRTLIDARTLEPPVAYALLELLPPAGVTVDPAKRPFVIVDPRAGHGPGIGGFKMDSEVGEAFRAGHPVYMVSFYPEPIPDQTLGDIAAAEAHFLAEVARRHPNAGKPVVIGNCQGGWAVMALAAARPGLTGPIVIAGAPLSYWAGASGKNPMRYNGGLFGGSWMCQFGCDLGNGVFDGAHLVSNFENLDLANTFWKKPFNLLSRVDTEASRFLEFERWWNGHYMLNEAEMRAIVEELFVANRLTRGEIRTAEGANLDLRNIRAPIVVFASSGDNITPPEQALNWIADVYGDTREIIANGQVIVYLKHERVGHLGIFVSGSVAVKEHRQIVGLLQHIERLVPGLYEMVITAGGTPQKPTYQVRLENREIADIVAADRDSRKDEEEFEVVNNISEVNSRFYDAFIGPMVRTLSNDVSAQILRDIHPARMKHYLLSDKNPVLRAVQGPADLSRAHRKPAAQENPLFAWRELVSDAMASWLDSIRITRDAVAENLFYATYGWMRVLDLGGAYQHPGGRPVYDESQVEALLARAGTGGVAEAVTRALIIGQRAQGISLPTRAARVGERLRQEPEFAMLTTEEMQRLLQEQTTIVAYAPERAVATMAELLPDARQRERAAQIIRGLIQGEEVDARFIAAIKELAHHLDLRPAGNGAKPPRQAARATRRTPRTTRTTARRPSAVRH